jgi:Cytochrome c554 and c-prime
MTQFEMNIFKTPFKLSVANCFGILVCCFGVITFPAIYGQANDHQDPRNQNWDLNINPHKVIGSESCEKCHSQEIRVWKQTPHFETFNTLHRKKSAQEIASKLGISSFKNDSNCIQCHYTMKSDSQNQLEAIAGVSCESCHGAAKDWIAVHNDYGGEGAKRTQEAPEHRIQRLTDSIQNGMRNPVNTYLVAQSCYRCHTVPDEKLVNVGGHVAGSQDFEIVSWSQGTVRHKFIESDGSVNAESTPERLRLLFMTGMIADLEFSLRATAKATTKDSFGVASAQRASRALKRLRSAQDKLQISILDQVLAVVQPADLKLNNGEVLNRAADSVHALGLQFAATVGGEALSAIDPFIPPKDKWK